MDRKIERDRHIKGFITQGVDTPSQKLDGGTPLSQEGHPFPKTT